MTNPSFAVRLTHILILANATVWSAFGILIGLGAHPSFPQPTALRWGLVVMSFAAAAVLVALAVLLRRRNRGAYWFSVILLAVISVGGVLDEVGWADLTFVGLTLLPLVFLLATRRWHLKSDGFPSKKN